MTQEVIAMPTLEENYKGVRIHYKGETGLRAHLNKIPVVFYSEQEDTNETDRQIKNSVQV